MPLSGLQLARSGPLCVRIDADIDAVGEPDALSIKLVSSTSRGLYFRRACQVIIEIARLLQEMPTLWSKK
jgi:hypothetical protein